MKSEGISLIVYILSQVHHNHLENASNKLETYVSQSSSTEIDTEKIAGEALRFIRENGVSVTEFAEKIARFQRAHVSLTLNHPVPMDKCR